MVRKPTIKKEVAILFSNERVRHIRFTSTNDAVTEFSEFGVLTRPKDEVSQEYAHQFHDNEFSLMVDPRYDFNEVLEYMENYG